MGHQAELGEARDMENQPGVDYQGPALCCTWVLGNENGESKDSHQIELLSV